MMSQAQHSKLVTVITQQLEDMGVYRSCLNCGYFKEEKEQCSLYGYQRPPARTIANGCEGWKEDIPF